MTATDLYASMTNRIIAAIGAGAKECRMPWHRAGLDSLRPVNGLTHSPYNGINIVSLWAEAQLKGCTRNLWATYRQWEALGAPGPQGLEVGARPVL